MSQTNAIAKHNLNSVLLLPVFFSLSYLLVSYYTKGDQLHYHRLYDALKTAHIAEITGLAVHYVASFEPLAAFVLWAGATLGLDKNLYISVLNLFLLFGIYEYARRNRMPRSMIALLLTNFYVIVLVTSAERLKIAYLTIVYAGLATGWIRTVLLAVTPLAHLQTIIMIPSVVLIRYQSQFLRLLYLGRFRKPRFFVIVLAFLTAIGMTVVIGTGVIRKGADYLQESINVTMFFQIGVLFVVSLLSTRNRFRMGVALLPFVFAVALLGGDRVNMIAFTVVVILLIQERRMNTVWIYSVMIYLTVKSIPYIRNIFVYGNGFYRL